MIMTIVGREYNQCVATVGLNLLDVGCQIQKKELHIQQTRNQNENLY